MTAKILSGAGAVLTAGALAITLLNTAPADAQSQIERFGQTDRLQLRDGVRPYYLRGAAVPADMRRKGCWFYMDQNGGGQGMRQVVTDFVPGSEGAPLYHTITTNLGNTWNDKISSVICDHDNVAYCYAIVYRDSQFNGQNTTIRGGPMPVNLNAAMNNAVTSFRVVCSRRN